MRAPERRSRAGVRTPIANLDDDHARMREVVGHVHRHRAQRPQGDVTDTTWRHSPMNRGPDPEKR